VLFVRYVLKLSYCRADELPSYSLSASLKAAMDSGLAR
jgi:hypothetical protein